MTKKYKQMYEHDYYKINALEITKNPTEKQIENAKIVQEYNSYYEKLLSGDRSSEVLKSLDKLQGKINGEDIN